MSEWNGKKNCDISSCVSDLSEEGAFYFRTIDCREKFFARSTHSSSSFRRSAKRWIFTCAAFFYTPRGAVAMSILRGLEKKNFNLKLALCQSDSPLYRRSYNVPQFKFVWFHCPKPYLESFCHTKSFCWNMDTMHREWQKVQTGKVVGIHGRKRKRKESEFAFRGNPIFCCKQFHEFSFSLDFERRMRI